MRQRSDSRWQILRQFIEGHIQEGTAYRAGAIYEAYLNEGGSAEITRKDFEMFLRDQVIKDDGLLKRVSHGVYEIRTNPLDRGVLFTRGCKDKETTEISLEGILDDSVELTVKLKTVFNHLEHQDSIPIPAQMELSRLNALLMRSMDQAMLGISATMAWCEDNMDMEPQNEAEMMTMGGI